MGNYLQMSTQQQVKALLDLGWTQRRIDVMNSPRPTISRDLLLTT